MMLMIMMTVNLGNIHHNLGDRWSMTKIMQIIITSVLMITLWLSTFQLILNERKEFKATIAPCFLATMMIKSAAGINYLGLFLVEKKLGQSESESDLPVNSGEWSFWSSLFHIDHTNTPWVSNPLRRGDPSTKIIKNANFHFLSLWFNLSQQQQQQQSQV